MKTTHNSKRTGILYKKRERKAKAKFAGVILLFVFFSIVGIFWGIPLLANLASVITSNNDKNLLSETQDNIPPSVPRISPLPSATNSAKISITGRAKPLSSIEFFRGARRIRKTLVDESGKFEITDYKLVVGENLVYVKAIDAQGNESAKAGPFTIVYDKTPPDLEITNPGEKEFSTSNEKIKFEGITEQDVILEIGNFQTVVNQKGEFNFLYPLSGGENKIEVKATDPAGNETKINFKIKKS